MNQFTRKIGKSSQMMPNLPEDPVARAAEFINVHRVQNLKKITKAFQRLSFLSQCEVEKHGEWTSS